jgi:hypothetical protein
MTMSDPQIGAVAARAPKLAAKLAARTTPALGEAGVAARDLGRYYALLERERPGAVVTPMEACLIRDVLPALRAARREGKELTLAAAVEARVRAGGGAAYEVEIGALVERLRGRGDVRLLAVIDLAERMNAAVRRGDVAAMYAFGPGPCRAAAAAPVDRQRGPARPPTTARTRSTSVP